MFDGKSYDNERDGRRLFPQLEAVKAEMRSGAWVTLTFLHDQLALMHGVKASQAAVSARVRDLRKDKFGGYTVDRRYVANGVWEYRMAVEPKEHA